MRSAIDWERDHAASGWRSRAVVGERYELIAYDDGDWEVRGPPIGHAIASGTEVTGEGARRRAIKVYDALTDDLPTTTFR